MIGDIDFVLVHGTFATNAPWMQPDAPLIQSLKQQFGEESKFHRFNWDGKNSYASRNNAANALAALLQSLKQPGHLPRNVVVIAHSHGGNVALQAAAKLGRSKNVDTIITLGTPFLNVVSRPLVFIDAYSAAFAFWIALAIWFGAALLLDRMGMLVGALSLTVGAAYVVSFFALYRVIHQKLTVANEAAQDIVSRYNFNGATDVPFLCIRHQGDEAGAWLFFVSLLRRLERIVFAFHRATERGGLLRVPMRFLLAFIGYLFVLFPGDIDNMWMLAPASLLLIPPLSIAGLFAISHKWGVAGKPSLATLCYEISIDERPSVPNCDIFRLSLAGIFRTLIKKSGLAITPHSLGYSDPKAISKISSWVKNML